MLTVYTNSFKSSKMKLIILILTLAVLVLSNPIKKDAVNEIDLMTAAPPVQQDIIFDKEYPTLKSNTQERHKHVEAKNKEANRISIKNKTNHKKPVCTRNELDCTLPVPPKAAIEVSECPTAYGRADNGACIPIEQ